MGGGSAYAFIQDLISKSAGKFNCFTWVWFHFIIWKLVSDSAMVSHCSVRNWRMSALNSFWKATSMSVLQMYRLGPLYLNMLNLNSYQIEVPCKLISPISAMLMCLIRNLVNPKRIYILGISFSNKAGGTCTPIHLTPWFCGVRCAPLSSQNMSTQ